MHIRVGISDNIQFTCTGPHLDHSERLSFSGHFGHHSTVLLVHIFLLLLLGGLIINCIILQLIKNFAFSHAYCRKITYKRVHLVN